MAEGHGSLFTTLRAVVQGFLFAFAAVVLGCEAYFASVLLPYDSDFIIFGLVVSSLTMLAILSSSQHSSALMESVGLFVLAVLWVAMGAFTVDRIGGVRCIDLVGQELNTGTNRTMSAEMHCKELKVILGFSWAEFATMTVMFLLVLTLTMRARTHGATSRVWNEPIEDLPWFGTWIDEERRHYQPQYPRPASVYPAQTFVGPNGTPQRIVLEAPAPGETVYYRPEDGYRAPMPSGIPFGP